MVAHPRLSVVVVLVGDTVEPRCDILDVAETLNALTQQINAPAIEIIVPYHAHVDGVDEMQVRFPQVNFLLVENLNLRRDQSGSREHHDQLRACGAVCARGEIIAFLEDHVRPDLNWATRVIDAHRRPYAVIGGAIENGVDRPLNWAVYFCDLGRYQNPVPAGESSFASTVNNSYKRAALEAIQTTWQNAFNETVVNSTLIGHGEKIALLPEIVVYQHRTRLRLKTVWQEFFVWGRSYAKIRSQFSAAHKQVLFAFLSPLLPMILLTRMTLRVMQRGRTIHAFVRAFPLTVVLTAAWSFGEFAGYFSSLARRTLHQPSPPLPQGKGS